MLKLQHAET